LTIAHGLFAQHREQYDAIFDEPLDEALDPAHADADRFPAAGAPKASPDAPDGDWEAMAEEDQRIINRIFVNYGKAIAAYIAKLNSIDSPFDRYVAGDTTAISKSAKNGLKLFVGKANCVECHSGPNFTDEKFHNTTHVSMYPDEVTPGSQELFDALNGFFELGHQAGIGYAQANPLNRDSEYSDDTTTPLLKEADASDPLMLAAYRSSPLRNITETGPYMHDGQFDTLEKVMEFYNDGGTESGFEGTKDELMEKLNLDDDEIKDLIEFMKTLTGSEIDSSLQSG
jgi:cytochrome c peroxidase